MQLLARIRLTRLIALLLILAVTGTIAPLRPAAASSPGTVVAWGFRDFDYGQIDPPTGLSGVTAVAAGAHHSLALKSDGTVEAWGSNEFGQATVPAGLSGVIAISAGSRHSLALKGDGTVVAWGLNYYGQASVPEGLNGVVAVSGGWDHSLALKSDGTVVAWGNNYYGQGSVPAGLDSVTAISAGGSHNLALKSDGTVVAWGSNQYGQSTVPEGLSGVTAISGGGTYSLVLRGDGTVMTWGRNDFGWNNPPAGLNDVVAIDAGDWHNIALKADGTVVVWYYPGYDAPANLRNVTAIAAGTFHSLVVGTIRPLDTTPPTISTPIGITVNATSPAGAVVHYSVTATDNIDPNPIVTCTPASGSTFPIGTTTVNCTATDAAGNTSSVSFLVTVRGAADQLSDLIALVQNLNLSNGIANSLDAKLQNTQDALDAARTGSITVACNKLDSFINEVQAQASNGTITQDQAEQLILAANEIKAVLGGS